MEALPDISIGIPPTPANMQAYTKPANINISKIGKSPGQTPGLSVLSLKLRLLLVVVDFFVIGVDNIVV